MRKYRVIFALLALTIAQCSFALSYNDDTSAKECETIANACLNGGFTNTDTPDKAFWHDCMQPLLLGKTVAGIDVDKKDVTTCRKDKIAKMKTELKQLELAAKKH